RPRIRRVLARTTENSPGEERRIDKPGASRSFRTASPPPHWYRAPRRQRDVTASERPPRGRQIVQRVSTLARRHAPQVPRQVCVSVEQGIGHEAPLQAVVELALGEAVGEQQPAQEG